MELTKTEWGLLFESLKYTQQAFEDYKGYPSQEYKQQRIQEVKDLRAKLRLIEKGLKNETQVI